MARFFLNALDPIDTQLRPPEHGHWNGDAADRKFLSSYAASIKIEGDIWDTHAAHSIPSVYARPIQFARSLFATKGDPFHEAFVAEWRGLLGVFALGKLCDLTTEVKKYKVPPLAPLEGGPAIGAPDDNLVTILRRQMPKPVAHWESWWLLFCDGALLGATSPWTGVYTAANYTCPKSVPWRTEDGTLQDPLAYFEQKGRAPIFELSVLHEWIRELREKHTVNMFGFAPDLRVEAAGPLEKQLEAWQEALRAHEHGLDGARLEAPSGVPEPYVHFLTAIRAAPSPSDLVLRAPTAAEPVLVFTRQGMDHRKRVWGTVFVDQVDVEQLPGPRGPGELLTRGKQDIPVPPYVIAEEEFLPTKLLRIPLARGTPDVNGLGLAVPVTRQLLTYFPEDQVTMGGMLTCAETPERIDVTLTLPLADGTEIKVTRSYDKRRDVVVLNEGSAPALGVWPDFSAPDWGEYYAACAMLSDSPLMVEPIRRGGHPVGRTRSGGEERDTRVWVAARPIVGFAMYESSPAEQGPVALGVVLGPRANNPTAVAPSNAWSIAVDFGTSNTNVRVKKGDNDDVPLKLCSRAVHCTRSVLQGELDLQLPPAEEVKPPFPTILTHRRAVSVFVPRQKEIDPTERRDSRYLPEFTLAPLKLSHAAAGGSGGTRIVRDVKWGAIGHGADGDAIRQYLSHLVRLICCEARSDGASGVTFHWSYPLALPMGIRDALNRFWKGVTGETENMCNLKVLASDGRSEAETVFSYLANLEPPLMPVRADALTVAVDIGGGSSDAAFWVSSTLRDQLSLRLAANDVLVGLASSESEFGREVYEACGFPNFRPNAERALAAVPGVFLNLVLRGAAGDVNEPYAHPVVRALDTRLSRSERPWLTARTLCYIFLSGIAFYLGLHARRCIDGFQSARVYFGGLGSSLMAWVGESTFVESAFKAGLALDAEQNKSVAIEVFAPQAAHIKEEVVRGLLRPMGTAAAGNLNATIVGEVQWSDDAGTRLDWNTEIDAARLLKLKPPKNHESGYMGHFLAGVLPGFAAALGLDDTNVRRLTIDTDMIIHYLRRDMDLEHALVQPVFAFELKAVMDKYLTLATRLR